MELSYGLREGHNADGSERADLLSAGVSMQMPLFTKQKQSLSVRAAQHRRSAAEYKRDEALNKLRFEFINERQQYQDTLAQRVLYDNEILPTLAKQRDSALQAYEADKGDFRSVIALFLKQQRARVMYQRLRVNEQLHLSSLNYLLGQGQGARK